MTQFFSVLSHIIRSYLAVSLMYRADFFQRVLTSLAWSAFSFISTFLITGNTPVVAGLSRPDLLLLIAAYGVIVGTHHFLCSHSFATIPDIMHKGELDAFLLKPFDPLTHLTFRYVSWASVPRIFFSAVIVAKLVSYYDLPVSILSVLSFLVLAFGSFLIIYSTYVLSSTLLIWHPYLHNINELVNTLVGTARYPSKIIGLVPWIAIVWFLPFLMVVNIPTQALIGQLSWPAGLLFLCVSVSYFLGARATWSWALRSYTGSSV